MTTEPQVTQELAGELGLSEEEYEQIVGTLGRTPTYWECIA